MKKLLCCILGLLPLAMACNKNDIAYANTFEKSDNLSFQVFGADIAVDDKLEVNATVPPKSGNVIVSSTGRITINTYASSASYLPNLEPCFHIVLKSILFFLTTL